MTIITTPPPAPERSDPATFPDRADAHVAWQSVFPAEINSKLGTPAAAIATLGLGKAALADILGTVAQTGGVPTGDIFQTGSNANGEFVRLASGLLICTRTITPSTGPETTAGNVFRDGGTAWTFPAAFASTPLVVGWSSLWFTWVSPANATNNATVANFHVMRSNSTASTIAVRVAAIGNWF